MKIYYIITVLIISLSMYGCTVKMGSTKLQTNFVYPNSNVEVLGHIKASIEKTNFFLYPEVTSEDINDLKEKAMSQMAGANLIINYKIDTEVTTYPIIPIFPLIGIIKYMTMVVTLEGDAAKMEVGKQILN